MKHKEVKVRCYSIADGEAFIELDNGKRVYGLPAAAPLLLESLQRLTEKIERANAIQHSGGRVRSEDWSELYDLANDARAAIARATGTNP